MELNADQQGKTTTAEDFKRKIASLALDTRLLAISTANGRRTLYQEPQNLARMLRNKLKECGQEQMEVRAKINSEPVLLNLEKNVHNLKNKFTALAQKRDKKIMELKHHSLGEFLKHYTEDIRIGMKSNDVYESFANKNLDMQFNTSVQNTMLKNSSFMSNLIDDRIRVWETKKREVVRQTEEAQTTLNNYSDTQLSYKRISYVGTKVNYQKRTRFLGAVRNYVKNKNAKRGDSMLDGVYGAGDSFRSYQNQGNSRNSAAAGVNPEMRQILDLVKNIQQNIDEAECKDLINLIMIQIEDIELRQLRGESDISKSRISHKIVKNTLRALCRTEFDNIFKHVNHNSRMASLNILNPSQESDLADRLYNYVDRVIVTEVQNRGICIEKDEDGTPIWAVLFYLYRIGREDIAKSIIQNYNSRIKCDVDDFFDLFSRAGSGIPHHEKCSIYARQIDSQEMTDFFKKILFSLVCNQDKDISSEFFFDEIRNYQWFWLMKYRLNDSEQDDREARGSVNNSLQILQNKIIDACRLDFIQALTATAKTILLSSRAC